MAKRVSKKAKDNTPLPFEKQIWDAACVLWGHSPAADYRKVIIGLIFLRYVSSRFEARYQQLVDEGYGFEDDRDFYSEENIFWVPAEARWATIAAAAHSPEIGMTIDNAMRAIERENDTLKDVLPKDYAKPELDKRVLGEVVDLFTNLDMGSAQESTDLLGRTYEYCITKFAAYEGANGGEFYTPASVVKLLVSILKPFENSRVYDPCCGSGGMFVQSSRFIEEHSGRRDAISVYGQESNPDTWKMAKINMAIRGISADFGLHHADTFHNDLHKTLKADFILANPPFNLSGWGQENLLDDVRWRYGTPPASNANYAWIQHMLHHLAPKGRIGIVIANSAVANKTDEEYQIRKALVEQGVFDCVISLPAQMFYTTKIKVSILFLSKDWRNKPDVLFIDARRMGRMESRTQRVLSDDEISQISDVVDAYFNSSGEPVKGDFYSSATIDEIRKKDYNLTPSKYIGGADDVDSLDWYYDLPYEEHYEELRDKEKLCATLQSKLLSFYSKEASTYTSSEVAELQKLQLEYKKAQAALCECADFWMRRVFKRWFIDYNYPNLDGAPYAQNGGKLRVSDDGDLIPEEWEVREMGSFMQPKSEKVGNLTQVPEYSATNRGIFPRGIKFNKALSSNTAKNKIIHKGDMVFGMSRDILNFGVMREDIGSVSPAYHVYNIDASVYNSEFLEIYMRLCPDAFVSLIKPGAREGQVLDQDELQVKQVLVPPLSLQDKYVVIAKRYLGSYTGLKS